MTFELSDLTKKRLAEDLLKHYYRHMSDKSYHFEKVEKVLADIKEEEPFYYKILEFLYLNNWTITKSHVQMQYCAKRTFFYKRDKMLLKVYDELLAME